jgi:hypothetical protein
MTESAARRLAEGASRSGTDRGMGRDMGSKVTHPWLRMGSPLLHDAPCNGADEADETGEAATGRCRGMTS